MNVGFFGDSFIDTCKNIGYTWPEIVTQQINCNSYFNGLSGTSSWWAYEIFLDYIHRSDILIFCHTNPWRWPHLPEEFLGKNWNVGITSSNGDHELLNQYFDKIFSKNLLNFIGQSIVDNVNLLAEKYDKYLINIFPFKTHLKFDHVNFPVIYNLDHVSWYEKVHYKNSIKSMWQICLDEKQVDCRVGHISPTNHLRLANIVVDMINSKPFNQKINCVDLEWNEFDPMLDKKYGA